MISAWKHPDLSGVQEYVPCCGQWMNKSNVMARQDSLFAQCRTNVQRGKIYNIFDVIVSAGINLTLWPVQDFVTWSLHEYIRNSDHYRNISHDTIRSVSVERPCFMVCVHSYNSLLLCSVCLLTISGGINPSKFSFQEYTYIYCKFNVVVSPGTESIL